MNVALAFWVPGRPKTKGSLTVVNGARGVLRENVAGSKEWRDMIRYKAVEARNEGGDWPLAGPVAVAATFYLPVVQVVKPNRKGDGYERTGDLDKLSRNLLDALQDAGVYVDDVQVVRLLVDKAAPGVRGRVGVDVRVLAP